LIGTTDDVLPIQVLKFLTIHLAAADVLGGGLAQLQITAFEFVSHVPFTAAGPNEPE
jgi:hypothetical protein